jgi:hypothetical protein
MMCPADCGGEPMLPPLRRPSSLASTWPPLPTDLTHIIYFRKVEDYFRKIVSVGRVKWMPGTKSPGKDNAAWHQFDETHVGLTQLHGRSKPLRQRLEISRIHSDAGQ